jgi:hypothetical protein
LAYRQDGTKNLHLEITVNRLDNNLSPPSSLSIHIIRNLNQIPIRIPRIHTLQFPHRTYPINDFPFFQHFQSIILQLCQNF